ncbi:hypothetical protein NL676_008977 [Syzygium grande]|nr:hypothetical protein NL676_008977 [Syzygium grande]
MDNLNRGPLRREGRARVRLVREGEHRGILDWTDPADLRDLNRAVGSESSPLPAAAVCCTCTYRRSVSW